MNTSNQADYNDYTIAYKVHHLKVFRTTTYFKRFYFGFTKQKRRKAACKKRLSFLIPHMNVLGMWANEYRFFRHEVKHTYTSNLFLVNYLINNNVSYANVTKLHSLKFGDFLTSSCANRTYRYYDRQNSLSFFMNKYTKSALVHTLTTYDPDVISKLDEQDRSISPLGYVYQNHVYSSETPTSDLNLTFQLFERVFEHQLIQLTLIYRLLVLTYLKVLNF